MSSFTPVGWWDDGVHPLSQANMKTVDQGLIDAHRGWRPITTGSLDTATNTIDISVPAGFAMLRLHVAGRLSGGVANVGVRVNPPTSLDHRWVFDELSGDGRTSYAGTSSSANVTRWGTVVQNPLTVHFLDTTGRCVYLADGGRISDTESIRSRTVGSGSLTASATITVLRVVSNLNFQSGSGALGTSWVLEGYRS